MSGGDCCCASDFVPGDNCENGVGPWANVKKGGDPSEETTVDEGEPPFEPEMSGPSIGE